MTSQAPIYLSGFGIHTCLGRGVAANVQALREPLREPGRVTFDFGGSRAELPYHVLADESLDDAGPRFYRVIERTIEEALREAGLLPEQRRELALFLGSSSGDISLLEAAYRRELLADADAQPMNSKTSFGNLGVELAERFDIRGPTFTVNTACTASANALLHAATLIDNGVIERALVVGIELCNAVTALGFSSLQLLGTTTMRPFDAQRGGLVLGEACAAVIVERQPRTRAWQLRGGSTLCDTFSPSAAAPDGSTIATVMLQALRAAQMTVADIDAVKVHGTASEANDAAEAAGTLRVFREAPAALCALKPRLGHTLGACGLTELVLLCAAAQTGFLPATPGIAAGTDAGLNLLQQSRRFERGHLMLNYFGFGGSNTSLIVGHAER